MYIYIYINNIYKYMYLHIYIYMYVSSKTLGENVNEKISWRTSEIFHRNNITLNTLRESVIIMTTRTLAKVTTEVRSTKSDIPLM